MMEAKESAHHVDRGGAEQQRLSFDVEELPPNSPCHTRLCAAAASSTHNASGSSSLALTMTRKAAPRQCE